MAEIGPTLRDARIRARIDMSEVETQTKIRARYLRAIENEEWDILPGPVYVKSFLRTYGDYLGLDSRMLIEEFKRRYEQPLDHDTPKPIAQLPHERRRDRGQRGPLVPPWAVIGVVLVAIAVALYVIGTGASNSTKSPAPAGLRAGAHKRAPAKAKPKRHLVLPSAARTVKLQLVPTAPVYVCLANGAGHVLIPGVIYQPGQTVPTFTQRTLLLTLGNASVQMKVNGNPFTVVASPSAIGYRIGPTGVSKLAPAQEPTCK